jgi:hypothetical protein
MTAFASRYLLLSGLVLFAPALQAAVLPAWQGVHPLRFVTIQGCMSKGQCKVWSTYQNGIYNKENYSGNFFRVPTGRTLVLIQADLTFSRDIRKFINLEFILNSDMPTFPLARVTFCNREGAPFFTVTKTFATGIVVPPGGQVNVVDKGVSSGEYEVMLYGFYLN